MAMQPKNGKTILEEFELQVDDGTELSTSEEYTVLNRVYREVLDFKDWLFLMKPLALTTDGSDEVALPIDFHRFLQSGQYTNRFIDAKYPYVIFLGENKQPYYYVNYLDREQYRNASGYFYIDLITNKIKFTSTPNSGLAVTGDYIYMPDEITALTYPVFPAAYHDILPYGMAVDDFIIQLFDKGKSYAPENMAKFQRRIDAMASWNDSFIHI